MAPPASTNEPALGSQNACWCMTSPTALGPFGGCLGDHPRETRNAPQHSSRGSKRGAMEQQDDHARQETAKELRRLIEALAVTTDPVALAEIEAKIEQLIAVLEDRELETGPILTRPPKPPS